MGGFQVMQALPAGGLDQIDPFLLLHHARTRLEGGRRQHDEGVPPHPHRGFAPVTFVYRGGVHHRDSRGNDSVIYEGGVQWMTAGMGIIHSERPPRALAEQGGEQEIIQLWVNLPEQHKMVQPHYQGLSAEEMPTVTSPDGQAVFTVVAGTFAGVMGPVTTYSPILALNATFRAGGYFDVPLPPGHNAFLYLLDGAMVLNEDRSVEGEHLVRLDQDGESIHLEAQADTRLLLMAGAPLDEPVVASGPFVMTNHTDILIAMRDYRMGKMGVLIEDS
jgi:redox-sensitive bicupin YhaK (pirin superfamily)